MGSSGKKGFFGLRGEDIFGKRNKRTRAAAGFFLGEKGKSSKEKKKKKGRGSREGTGLCGPSKISAFSGIFSFHYGPIRVLVIFFFLSSFVDRNGCRRPFVCFVRLYVLVFFFRIYSRRFLPSGRSISDALFFPVT